MPRVKNSKALLRRFAVNLNLGGRDSSYIRPNHALALEVVRVASFTIKQGAHGASVELFAAGAKGARMTFGAVVDID